MRFRQERRERERDRKNPEDAPVESLHHRYPARLLRDCGALLDRYSAIDERRRTSVNSPVSIICRRPETISAWSAALVRTAFAPEKWQALAHSALPMLV